MTSMHHIVLVLLGMIHDLGAGTAAGGHSTPAEHLHLRGDICEAVKSQKAGTAYLTSKQLLPFFFADQ